MERQCRCINPPDDTLFEKDGIYEWGFIIDGFGAIHESGFEWSAGEIEFLMHFQILSGKRECDAESRY